MISKQSDYEWDKEQFQIDDFFSAEVEKFNNNGRYVSKEFYLGNVVLLLGKFGFLEILCLKCEPRYRESYNQ